MFIQVCIYVTKALICDCMEYINRHLVSLQIYNGTYAEHWHVFKSYCYSSEGPDYLIIIVIDTSTSYHTILMYRYAMNVLFKYSEVLEVNACYNYHHVCTDVWLTSITQFRNNVLMTVKKANLYQYVTPTPAEYKSSHNLWIIKLKVLVYKDAVLTPIINRKGVSPTQTVLVITYNTIPRTCTVILKLSFIISFYFHTMTKMPSESICSFKSHSQWY